MRKPFFKKSHDAWYVHHGSKYIRLGSTEEEAYERWQQLQREPITGHVAVVVLLDAFLEWNKHNRAERTYEWYQRHLQPFAKHIGGKLTIAQLRPHHVSEWANAFKNVNTRHGAMRTVQRACNWAVKEGYINSSPLTTLQKPQPTRREVYIQPEQWEQMIAMATDQPEKDFLIVIRETGMRPQEMRTLEDRHFDPSEQRLVFTVQGSKGKKQNRVIYLTPVALEIIKRLTSEHKSWIFRNSRGDQWTRNAIRCRFRKFKRELDIPDLCSTAIRHVYISEALKNGVDSVTLANLVGHTSTAMISRHYSHLMKSPEYMRQQARKAVTGTSAEAAPSLE